MIVKAGWTAGFLMFMSACAPRLALHYELTADALSPPAVKSPFRLRGAGAAKDCGIEEGPLAVRVRGRDAVLRLGRGVTSAQLEQFRAKVLEMEDSECLVRGGAGRILNAVASSVALPSMQIYNIRHGNYQGSGWLDLDANFRLKTVSPLLRQGVKEIKVEAVIPDSPGAIAVTLSPGLEGFETSYYELRSVPGGGLRPVLASVQQSRNGKIAAAEKPAGFSPDLPVGEYRLRLVFMRANTGAIRDILLLAAATYASLDAATRRLQTAEDNPAACRSEKEAVCLLVPKLSVIAPELRVTGNGKPVYVPLGGTVRDALRAAGMPASGDQRATAARLRVLRPWRDRMIPVLAPAAPEKLLGLVLTGGERIDW